MIPRQSPEVVEQLLLSHRSLVPSVARRLFPSLQRDPDLLQCGLIGLWRAAQRWDGKRPFPSYARVCIHHAMVDWLRRSGSPLRETALDESLPAPESHLLDDEALRQRIASAWPAGSRERQVLLSLASPSISKPQLAHRMGLTTAQLTRLARRAWVRVPPE